MSKNVRIGKRMTKTRKAVLSAVSHSPLTIYEISDALTKRGVSHDLATIYRNVNLLTKEHILTKVQLDDKIARYEKMSGPHHHHLICEHCGDIEDIPLKEETLLKQVEATHNFSIKRHTIEFFGLCDKCKH